MRLTIDLRFNAPPQPSSDDERVVTLNDLAELRREPRALWLLLRGTRYASVRVLQDRDLPLSGVQAGGLGIAALADAKNFAVAGRGPGVSGQLAFLRYAAVRFAVSMSRELVQTAVLRRRAVRAASTSFALPLPRHEVRAISYLRAEPSLRWLGAQIGGASSHTAGVIMGLAGEGLDVHVFAAERPARTQGVPFTAVPPRRIYQLVQWLTLTDYTCDVVNAAQGRAADVVYQRYALGSYAGLELARRLSAPLILEFNGSEVWATRHWGTGRLPMQRTLLALERRNLLDATLIVVTSDVLRDDLVADGIPEGKILVNPNGVDVERLNPLRATAPAEWRARLGRKDAPTVGFIGTFGLWHGVKLLPAMVEAVARKRADVRWVLIGDGPLREEVGAGLAARGLSDTVDLTGVIPHDEAVELLASCDVCVSPHVPNPDGTRFFGSPTKLFEYMGLGKAIVASDLEQIGEVLDHERSGLLCEPGDAVAAADAVLRLLADPELARRLGEAALADATERYSWSAHTRRILDAYAALQAAR